MLIFIISSWAIPFAIWPSSIFLGSYFSTTEPTCVHPARPFIIVILCTFFYYIPLFFMLACYSKIIANIKNMEVLVSLLDLIQNKFKIISLINYITERT